jgi:uncharacterized protein (TIGR00369 family)
MPEMPTFPRDPIELAAYFREHGRDFLPGLMGIEVLDLAPRRSMLGLQIEQKHLALNGYLHAGTVVTLADTAAGYGTVASLPEGARGFTTLELKSNHIGTALSGRIVATSVLSHGGRTTQVWDTTVTSEADRRDIALVRCTQMILYPTGG